MKWAAFFLSVTSLGSWSAYAKEFFPTGDLFQPLVADPRVPMFRLGLGWSKSDTRETLLGQVVMGETFGIVRWKGENEEKSYQLDLTGAVYTQFDLRRPKASFTNVDYIGGIPFSYRSGDFSARVHIYHQSSHLGDEFIIKTKPTRIDFNFESFEFLASWDRRAFRYYAGGEYIFRASPRSLDRALIHGGLEYRSDSAVLHFGESGIALWMGALDVKLWQEATFIPSVNFVGGLEFVSEEDIQRQGRFLRFLLEAYRGIIPYGQFFTQDIDVISAGFTIQAGF